MGACDGYTFDFLKYVFNFDPTSFADPGSKADLRPYTDAEKKTAASIQAGDVLGLEFDTYGQHSRHAIVVLQRNGSQLITAEGNMDGHVVISDSWYYIQNNQLCRRVSSNLVIIGGTHYLH